MRCPAILVALALTLPNFGCSRTINALTSNPDIRKQVNEKGKASCMQASIANQKQPVSPELTAKLDTYCDCITVKGLGQFSNAELIELGMNKSEISEPKYQTRIKEAARVCTADVFHK